MTDSGKRPEKKGAHVTFKVAVAGQGVLLRRLCGILSSDSFSLALPHVGLSAILLKEGALAEEYSDFPCLNGLRIYTNAADLFREEKGLRLVLTTDGDHIYEDDLRGCAPAGVNLLSSSAVRFICRAVEEDVLALDGAARIMRMRQTIKAMIDHMDEEVLLLDAKCRIAEANKFFLETRQGALEDYIGLPCAEAMGDECCCKSAEGEECIWKINEARRESVTKVYNRVNSDGQVEYYRVLILPLPIIDAEHGEGISMFMRKNISSLLQMQQKLQQSEKMATIGELSAYIAHEIRNPLFAISGFANALKRSPVLDDSAKDKAQVILEEARRLDGILKSFINFAKPSEHELSDLDAAQAIAQAVKLASLEDFGQYEVEEKISPNLPKVRANTELLREGLGNIIQNAMEAMPEGGKITVSAAPSGHMIELAVEDRGSGIPEEQQSQIFSPFFSTKGKGAGLGLAMTKKFIEDMGGKVTLQSAPGKGTRVGILLLPALAVSKSSVSMISTPGNGTRITVKLPKVS